MLVGPLSAASWQLAANACTVEGTAHVPAEKGVGRGERGREDDAGSKLDSSTYSFISESPCATCIMLQCYQKSYQIRLRVLWKWVAGNKVLLLCVSVCV